MANAKFCRRCGAPLTPAAHFCAQCGLDLSGASAASDAPGTTLLGTRGLALLIPWFVLASLLMAVLGYFIGTRAAPPPPVAVEADPFGGTAPIVAAPDISSLSPEERVDRLFNRVMSLAAAGK